MAPRKVIWKQCDRCKVILWNKDVDAHRDQCDVSKLESNKCLALQHGFIENLNLYAVLKFKKDDGGGLARIFNKDVAFLHPSAMKRCKICCTDRILVTASSGYQTLHTVWPDSTIAPTTVLLSKCSLTQSSSEEIVHVKSYHRSIISATLISLSLENPDKMDFVAKSEFKAMLLNQNCGHFICIGTRISCNYYGNRCKLVVKSIEGESPVLMEIPEVNISATEDCVNEISALTLDDSTDKSVMKCSTPLKSNMETLNSFSSVLSATSYLQDISESEALFYSVSPQSTFKILSDDTKKNTTFKITFHSIGGLQHQIQTMKEILHLLKLSFSHPELKPKGILLCGPSGTGKTMMAHAIANEWNGTFISVDGPKIYSNLYGESEAKLIEIFEEASERAPTIIFIDEIDSLCPRRQGVIGVEERIITTLHSLIDNLSDDSKILIIAATNRPEAVDQGLLKPGRLGKQIEFGFPSSDERHEILTKLLKLYNHTLSEEDVRNAADKLHGCTGADLAALCRNAWFNAAKGYQSTKEKPVISSKHFTSSVKDMKPSAMREISVEIPMVHWTDIGGMQSVKEELQKLIDWPRIHRDVFERMGLSQRRGLLMFGPPGCSKTMIAKAVATESGLNFIAIKGPELFNKWVGESEKSVRQLFQRARSVAPCIVFFDEIDALAAERGSDGGTNVADRVLTQLLTEMDGLSKLNDVFVIAATNRPDRIDKALQRPGRLDCILYIPLPDFDTRRDILKIQFRKMPVAEDVKVEELVRLTEGYSGAELVGLCHQAALKAMSECINCESTAWRHFILALEEIQPRTSSEMIQFYEDFARRQKSI